MKSAGNHKSPCLNPQNTIFPLLSLSRMPSNKNRQGLCTHGRRPVPFPCYARPDITLDSCLDPVVSICARPLPPVTYTQKESNSFSSNLYCFPDFPLMACLTCVLRATAHNYDKVLRQPGEAGGQHFYWHLGLSRWRNFPCGNSEWLNSAVCGITAHIYIYTHTHIYTYIYVYVYISIYTAYTHII